VLLLAIARNGHIGGRKATGDLSAGAESRRSWSKCQQQQHQKSENERLPGVDA